MKKNVRLPTVWLTPQLLAAVTEAAAKDGRTVGGYIRSIAFRDCQHRKIPIDLPPEDGPRLATVAMSRQMQDEIDGPDRPK